MATTVLSIFALLLIIGKSQRGSRITRCNDYRECHNATRIRNSNIECNGQESCAYSLTTTPRAGTGYIRCSAYHSCEESEITALGRKDVYCSGASSCYRTESVAARNLYCIGGAACLNNAFFNDDGDISVTNNIVCGGSAACYGNEAISAGGSIKCSGDISCRDTQITAGSDIDCSGSRGCWVSILETPGTVYCSGFEACHGAIISAGTAVKLYGYDATDTTTITNTPLIEGYGADPLGASSTIDSGSLSAMTVRLTGSSTIGRNAFVFCRSGAVCDLFCESTGCGNVIYQCEDGATCNISPNGCSTNSGGIVRGISCPMITSTMSKGQKHDVEDNENALDIFHQNDDILSSDATFYCSTESECASQIFSGSRSGDLVYCQGLSSCENAEINARVYCHGDSSCVGAEISVPNDYDGPYCYGEHSCKDVVGIHSMGGTVCSGFKSCIGSDIYVDSGTVGCTGIGACQDTNIYLSELGKDRNSAIHLVCTGESSCENAVVEIESVGDILCEGLNSCLGATLTSPDIGGGGDADYAIRCWGEGSCKDAVVTATGQYAKIEIAGYLGATGAFISIEGIEVLVSGYQGLADGVIDSDGASDLKIVLNAAQAMYGGTLICRTGSICNVICKGSSCENMDYLCESGATCNVEPSGCASSPTPTAVANNICPDITSIFSSDIEGFLQRKKMTKENDEVYIEIQDRVSMNVEKSKEYIFDINKYDDIDDEELLFGEVGVMNRVISLKENQMILFGIIASSVCIGLIVLFYKMILRNKEYIQLK